MRSLTFWAILLLSFSTAHSQNLIGGVRIAVNIATSTGKIPDFPDDNFKSRAGFNAELYSTLTWNSLFGAQLGVGYSEQGARYEIVRQDTSGQSTESHSMNLQYLNFPVVFRWTPVERIHVLLGPQVGVLLRARDRVSISGSNSSERLDERRDEFRPVAVDGLVGVAFYLTPSLFVDARYTISFNDVTKASTNNHNSVLSFGLGIGLD
ncbi:porin family protein [Pontibacter sp. G13]|uniref:porin family protein n=1 Tax=Pontibacter sp. G13 TaxID=3074898 RepID=UPI00288AC15D|nr:porin family protein [Pontibacter sp. G13]WNJ19207.1 porin family protein [Pontibacter sp. G13]